MPLPHHRPVAYGPMPVVASQLSPDGSAQAIVEDDGRVVYLYLVGASDESSLGMRPVWVRNRIAAPGALDRSSMRDGDAPLMPASGCAHPAGAPALDASSLRFVWLPEGDGVALFQDEEMLAAVPPWAGRGFYGYARDARGEAPWAWSLEGAHAIADRFREAERYWSAWADDSDPWRALQTAQMERLESSFGPERRYFAIDGGAWPPRGLAVYEARGSTLLATNGVALRPQPCAELVESARRFRRIELGAVLPACTDEALKEVGGCLSDLASLPWRRATWLGPGHSIATPAFARWGYAGALFARADAVDPRVALPDALGEPVTLLWAVPVTADELERARASGADTVLRHIRLPRSGTAAERGPSTRTDSPAVVRTYGPASCASALARGLADAMEMRATAPP